MQRLCAEFARIDRIGCVAHVDELHRHYVAGGEHKLEVIARIEPAAADVDSDVAEGDEGVGKGC